MNELTEMLKNNKGIVAGSLLGYFGSGEAINRTKAMLTPLVGQVAGRWLTTGTGLLVTGAALLIGKKFKKTQMAVAFAGVSLGHTINAGITATKGS